MDQNIVLLAAIGAGFYYFGKVKNAPPTGKSIPLTPIQQPHMTPIVPVNPNSMAPLQGTCFGVTDKAYGPFYPNIKNPCPKNVFGWNLINPSLAQCRLYVGPTYVPALGGCIVPNNSGAGKTLFIVANSGKQNK